MLRSRATESCDDSAAPVGVPGDGWDVGDAPEHPVSAHARTKATTRLAVLTVVGPRRARGRRVGGVVFDADGVCSGPATPCRTGGSGSAAPRRTGRSTSHPHSALPVDQDALLSRGLQRSETSERGRAGTLRGTCSARGASGSRGHAANGDVDALLRSLHRLHVEPSPCDAPVTDAGDDHTGHVQTAAVLTRPGPTPIRPHLIVVTTVVDQLRSEDRHCVEDGGPVRPDLFSAREAPSWMHRLLAAWSSWKESSIACRPWAFIASGNRLTTHMAAFRRRRAPLTVLLSLDIG